MRDDQELPTQVDLETEASLSTGEQHWEAERKAWLAGPGRADNMDDVPSPRAHSSGRLYELRS